MLRQCDICKKDYTAEKRYLNRGQGKTCSHECGIILSSQKRKKEKTPNTFCSFCFAPLYRKNSSISNHEHFFCNAEHMQLAQRQGIIKTGPKSTILNKMKCLYCEKITRNSDSICQRCQKTTIAIGRWLSGDNDATLNISKSTGMPVDTKKFVKAYLKETRGDCCEQCGFFGINPATGNSIIQLEHVDGNCFNNHPDNLKLLCPNCHAMTPTYGSLNKGSGRGHRRKRSI